MDSCLVGVFSCLSCLGARNWLLENFAFRSIPFPTYTLRSQSYEVYKKTNSESNDETQLKLDDSRLTSHTTQQLMVENTAIDQDSENQAQIRSHRVSGQILVKESRILGLGKSFATNQPRSGRDMESQRVESMVDSNLKAVKLREPESKEMYPTRNLYFITFKKEVRQCKPPDDIDVKGYYLENSLGYKFACVLVQLNYLECDYCLIHSHGNNPDIGVMIDSYLDLSFNLKVAVLGYDYPGYGQAEKSYHDLDEQCIANLQAVYQFAVNQLKFEWRKIILYGQSIGSGPAIAVVVKRHIQSANDNYLVGGLIVHAGFKSGLSVIKPQMETLPKCDFFPNIELIEKVTCNILFIHGDNDQQISHTQSEALLKKCKDLQAGWGENEQVHPNKIEILTIPKAGHNNIEFDEDFRRIYFRKMQRFVQELSEMNRSMSAKDCRELHRSRQQSYNNRRETSEGKKRTETSSNRKQNKSVASKNSEIELVSSYQESSIIQNQLTRTQSVQNNKKKKSQDNINVNQMKNKKEQKKRHNTTSEKR